MIIALILIGVWLEVNNWKSYYRLQKELEKKKHVVKVEDALSHKTIYYDDGSVEYKSKY